MRFIFSLIAGAIIAFGFGTAAKFDLIGIGVVWFIVSMIAYGMFPRKEEY